MLDTALERGATSAEAAITSGTGLSVTVRMGEADKIEREQDKALALTVYMDGQKGSIGTSDFSQGSLVEAVSAAADIAGHAGQDKCAGLVEAGLMATEIVDLDLCHPWAITPEQAVDLAIECENHALSYDKRINNSDGAVVSTYSGMHVYGNTHGFINGWPWSSHTISCAVIAEDVKGMQCDGWYSKSRDHLQLQELRETGEEAGRRAVSRLGSERLSTRNTPVLFEAPVASGLFSALITAISGGSLYRRASFLLDQKGQKIFSDNVRISENPHLKKALGSAPFDNDGVATRTREIVTDGVLQDYVLSGYSARKLGLETTGNAGGVHNLVIEPGEHDLSGLLKMMDRGVLVTDMIGFGVNQVTGDYSRGASGFWVENGEVRYPVDEITVAGNLKEMYKNVIAVGKDVDPRGNILTGSVLVENMAVAGE